MGALEKYLCLDPTPLAGQNLGVMGPGHQAPIQVPGESNLQPEPRPSVLQVLEISPTVPSWNVFIPEESKGLAGI